MVASKLGAQGADVIWARAAGASRGFKPTRGCGNSWKLQSLPRGSQWEAEEGSVLAVQTPNRQLMPSVCFSKHESPSSEDMCSQVAVLGKGLHPRGYRWKEKKLIYMERCSLGPEWCWDRHP